MTQLTPKVLLLYDRKGLLVPEEKDAFTNYRCYTYDQIERGSKIRTLSWMGFYLTTLPAAKVVSTIYKDLIRKRVLSIPAYLNAWRRADFG
jgi:hypothetical protein